MRLKLTLPSPVDADIVLERDANEKIVAITMRPRFYKSNELKTMIQGVVVGRDEVEIDKFALKLSGSNGTVTKTTITDRKEVDPQYYNEGPTEDGDESDESDNDDDT